MKHVRNYTFFLIICAFFSLSACTESKSGSFDIQQDVPSDTQQFMEEATKIEQTNQNESSISKTLSSGVKVTASVEIPNNVSIDQLAMYNAEIVKQNYDSIKETLLVNKQIVEEESSEVAESRTDSLYHYCIADDGSSLSYNGEGFTYDCGKYSLFQNILNNRDINVNQFSENNDLGFSTREDVQLDIKHLLDQLDIEVNENPICYTLSFESLQSICEEINVARKKMLGEDSPLYTPLSCNPMDACYIFIYQVTPKGLPISKHTNGVFGDGSWTPGTYLSCFYTEEGIVGMDLPYSLRVTEQISQRTQGLSVGQILEKLDEKFSSMILVGDYLANNIEFEYVPLPIDGSRSLFRLIPAWRISILHTFQYKDEKKLDEVHFAEEQFDVVFNAISGEEILSSLGSI